MTSKKILVTGGAGFIGSHLVDDLLAKNHSVVVYDNLEPQVHGDINKPPDYLAKNITFVRGDILDDEKLYSAMKEVDVIFHLAAVMGVGQSMYKIDKFTEVNTLGTAKLLNILVNKPNTVKKFIIASSMSTYGEGRYICETCGKIDPNTRSIQQMTEQNWELNCPNCEKLLKPIPTDEEKFQDCTSIYALTKKEQEQMSLLIGKTYGITTTALRFFNVYGSRQSLSNPYTGVCTIFSNSLLNGNQPIVFEDGKQSRDFVHVKDITQSLILAMEKSNAKSDIFNVGTGISTTIGDVALTLAKFINPKIQPKILKKFRVGDIRHCIADISKIKSKLGYKPKYSFEMGMKELIEWVKSTKEKNEDKSKLVNDELKGKGLL